MPLLFPDFYPRPPRGGRRGRQQVQGVTKVFLSTPSARRATLSSLSTGTGGADFYPRPPRGGRRCHADNRCLVNAISIHALREEGDDKARLTSHRQHQFLSTPSARRATQLPLPFGRRIRISIHALREEGDLYHFGVVRVVAYFYPRPPRGGRRRCYSRQGRRGNISIHALREEGDWRFLRGFRRQIDFYPRPPRGGRHPVVDAVLHQEVFLSTPSARRATRAGGLLQPGYEISIHALREEGDCSGGRSNFYPRPRRGGRRPRRQAVRCSTAISIPALREEGDFSAPSALRTAPRISIHALREEGDLPFRWSFPWLRNFYPRPPRGGRQILRERLADIRTISIHALREEGDGQHLVGEVCRDLFLSTPSARRATAVLYPLSPPSVYFYPRPPRGGRRLRWSRRLRRRDFYPRPPRGGRQQKQRQNLYFQTNYTTFCTNLEEP